MRAHTTLRSTLQPCVSLRSWSCEGPEDPRPLSLTLSSLVSPTLAGACLARHEIVSVACFPAKIIYALIYIKNAYASYFGGVRTDVDRTPDRALVGVECTDLEVPSGRVDEGVGKPACAHVAPCFASTLHAWACALHALAIGRWQCSGAPVALVGRA